MNTSTLAERLVYARNLRNISQEKLSELSGASQSAIGDIESGKVKSPRNIGKIAKALRVSLEWLAEDQGQCPTEHDEFP